MIIRCITLPFHVLKTVISVALTDLRYPESVCTSVPLLEAPCRLLYVGSKYAAISLRFRTLFVAVLPTINQLNEHFDVGGFPSFLANDYTVLHECLRPVHPITFPPCLYDWFNLKPFVNISLSDPLVSLESRLAFVNPSSVCKLSAESQSDVCVKSIFPNVKHILFTFSSPTATLDLTELPQLLSVTICNIDSSTNKILGLESLSLERVSFDFFNGNNQHAVFPPLPLSLKHISFADIDPDVGELFSNIASDLLLKRLESATFSHFTLEIADSILPRCTNLQSLSLNYGWFDELSITNMANLTDLRFEVCLSLTCLNFNNVPRLSSLSVQSCFSLTRINGLDGLNLLKLSVPCCLSMEFDGYLFMTGLLFIELSLEVFSKLPFFSSKSLRCLRLLTSDADSFQSDEVHVRFPSLKVLNVFSNN
ncbi:hypothetical protein RCL1_006666 [Eukaryota sp. TZLM3-RCL]